MRICSLRTVRWVVAAVCVTGSGALLHAQFQNPIQAAKDAYEKSKQQAAQQRAQTAAQPAGQQPVSATDGANAGAANAGSSNTGFSSPGPECCTPDAMKKVAATLGFVDIAGIKLGMTPAQALAAVRAFNPKMKANVIQGRVESPDAPGSFTRVPLYIVAHTVGVPPYPSYPAPFALADGSSDEIVLEFTIPPSPPLLGKITRMVTFPTGQPIVASNLVEALHKKYGDENQAGGGGQQWVFDASGKLLSRQLSEAERRCVPSNAFDGFGWSGGGQMPNNADDLTRDAPTPVNLTTTGITEADVNMFLQRAPVCRPFTIG